MAIALKLAVIPLCVLESEVPADFLTGQIPLLLNMKHVFKAEISEVLKCERSSNSILQFCVGIIGHFTAQEDIVNKKKKV